MRHLMVPAVVVLALSLAAAPPAAAAGDAAAGKALFGSNCALCHSVVKGKTKNGPSLWGVVGRPSGIMPGFEYSKALKSQSLVWDEATLDDYLIAPLKKIPRGYMNYAGMPKAQDRQNLIAYLSTLK